jgi:hypothetical protein
MIKVALGGVVLLIGAGFGLYSWWQTQKSVVFFDNTLDHAVELSMDGSAIGSVAPGQALILEVDEGSHELVANGPSGEVDRGTFQVADGSGFRGLFSIGGRQQYIVVRGTYNTSGTGETTVQPLPAGQKFYVLPGDVSSEGLDLTFPTTVTMQGDSMTLVHVCHYDPSNQVIGCPGA